MRKEQRASPVRPRPHVTFQDLEIPGNLKLGDRVRVIWEGDVASVRPNIFDGVPEVLHWENETIRAFKVDRD